MVKILVGMEESVGAVIQRCSVNKVLKKLQKTHWKLPVLEYPFNEISAHKTGNVFKQ